MRNASLQPKHPSSSFLSILHHEQRQIADPTPPRPSIHIGYPTQRRTNSLFNPRRIHPCRCRLRIPPRLLDTEKSELHLQASLVRRNARKLPLLTRTNRLSPHHHHKRTPTPPSRCLRRRNLHETTSPMSNESRILQTPYFQRKRSVQ